MNIGAVVFDTNTLKYLERDDVRRQVQGSLRAADLGLRLSALNVLEVVKSENPRVRTRLLRIAATLTADRWVIPEPPRLLKRTGEAILAGEHGFVPDRSGLEWMLEDPERIDESHVREAQRILGVMESEWQTAHDLARATLQPMLRAKHGGDPWGSIAAFLEQQWTTVEQGDGILQSLWTLVGLPGPAPIEVLLGNEVWRLFYEAIGAVVYERTIPNKLPKPAHMADVFQLIYLAGAARRVLVTEDGGLLRVANQVLSGRYAGSRVMPPAELLVLAG